jgi:prepilin-type processing-associated H-X9-DG protein
MFPAAAYYVDSPLNQMAWDGYLNPHLGGRLPTTELKMGKLSIIHAPKVVICCADPRLRGRKPDVGWNPGGLIFGRRSYAMVGVGPTWRSEWQVQVTAANGMKFQLPRLNMGVGIYWTGGTEDADPSGVPSYKTSVIKDNASTLLVVEQVCDQNIANDQWPSVSLGPVASSPNSSGSSLCQLDAPGGGTYNYGHELYKSHTKRFNYLFHDSHVERLRIEQTVGRGTLNAPLGMWTISPND